MSENRTQFHMTTQQLRTLCDQGEALGFAHGPTPEFWDVVHPDETRHLVEFWMEHRPYFPIWEGIDHGFDFAHNDGLNVRALLSCVGKRGEERLLRCDFDHHAFMTLVQRSAISADTSTPKQRADLRKQRHPRNRA